MTRKFIAVVDGSISSAGVCKQTARCHFARRMEGRFTSSLRGHAKCDGDAARSGTGRQSRHMRQVIPRSRRLIGAE
jgi:hypothetical protein